MPDFRLFPFPKRSFPVLFCGLFLILSNNIVWGQVAVPQLLPPAIVPAPNLENEIRRNVESGLHQPDRETLQNLKTADLLLQEKRYSEAVRIYWQLLQLPEDAFIDPNWEQNSEIVDDAAENENRPKENPKPINYSSLKTYIQWRLATLDAEGRQVTDIVIEPQANQDLKAALNSGQLSDLSAVGKRYFPSESGVQALFLLGILELNDGNAHAALAQFDYLQRFPEIRRRLDPAFSLFWASSIILSGNQEARQETLTPLRDYLQTVRWNLEAQLVQGLNEQSSIDRLLGVYRPQLEQFQQARFQSPVPLLSLLWRVPNYDTPLLESFLTHIYEQENNLPTHSPLGAQVQGVFKPVVKGDLVFMRDLFELTAIDRKTGKRVWKATTQTAGDIQRRWEQIRGKEENSSVNWLLTLKSALELRVLFDKTYAALSVDESNVYAIEDIWTDQLTASNVQNIGNILFLGGGQSTSHLELTNRLAAYDQKTGRLLWTCGRAAAAINGNRETALDEVGFLGVPLKHNKSLYILGKSQDLISLYKLNPKTGKLLWSQPLTQSKTGYLENLINLSVQEINGILICPLSPSSLAAVDPDNQRLLWGFDSRAERNYANNYFRNAIAVSILIQQMQMFFPQGYQQRLFSLYGADNKILYSPMESNVVYCLDAATGKAVQQLNTYEGSRIMTVKDSTVFLLASNRIEINKTLLAGNSANNPAEETVNPTSQPSLTRPGNPPTPAEKTNPEKKAETANPVDLSEAGPQHPTVQQPQGGAGANANPQFNVGNQPNVPDQPDPQNLPQIYNSMQNETCNLPDGCSLAGEGFRYKDCCYIPVSGGELLEFNLTKHKFTARMGRKDGQPLGNLVCGEDQVFSQSFLSLDSFDIKELVEKDLAKRLQEQPNNFRNLLYGAYLAWSEENWDQAADYLLKLYAHQPRPSLNMLQTFFDAASKESPEILDKYEQSLEKTLVSPEEKIWLLKYQALRLAKNNRMAECLDRLKQLQAIDQTGEWFVNVLESGNRTLKQRSDVWLGHFLQSLYQQSNPEDQERIRQRAQEHIEQLSQTADQASLIRALSYYGFLPESQKAAETLYQQFVKSGQNYRAELVLRWLRNAPYANANLQAQTWARQVLLLSDSKPQDAARALKWVKETFPQAKVFPDHSGNSNVGANVDQYVQGLPDDSPVRLAYLEPVPVWPTGALVGKVESDESTSDQRRRALDTIQSVPFGKQTLFLDKLMARLNVELPQTLDFYDSLGNQALSLPVELAQQMGRIVVRSTSSNTRAPWWAAEHQFFFSGKDGELSAINFWAQKPAIVWTQDYTEEVKAGDPWSLIQTRNQRMTNALPPAFGVHGNTVLFRTGAKNVLGIDVITGKVKWRKTLAANTEIEFANDDYFLVPDAAGTLFRKTVVESVAGASITIEVLDPKKQPKDKKDATDKDQTKAPEEQKLPFRIGQRVLKYSMDSGQEIQTDKPLYLPTGVELIIDDCLYYKEPKILQDNKMSCSIGLYSVNENKNRWKRTFERVRTDNDPASQMIEPIVDEKESLIWIAGPDGEVEVIDLLSGTTLLKTKVEAVPAEQRNKLVALFKKFQDKEKAKLAPVPVPPIAPAEKDDDAKKEEPKILKKEEPQKEETPKPGKNEENGGTGEKTDEKVEEESVPDFMPGVQERFLRAPYNRILVYRDGDDIILIAYNTIELFRQKEIAVSQFYSSSGQLINQGQIYRFNRAGKMVWSNPVPIERQYLCRIPSDLPFLMFGRNSQKRSGSPQEIITQGQMFLLDKQTGVLWEHKSDKAFAFVDITGSPDRKMIRIASGTEKPIDIRFSQETLDKAPEAGTIRPLKLETDTK